MTIPKDSSAAADAFRQPDGAVIEKLMFLLSEMADDTPRHTSVKQQKRIAKALAYGEELHGRFTRKRRTNPPC